VSFEMLYGRRCRTPLFWSETDERKVFGPGILQEVERQVQTEIVLEDCIVKAEEICRP
jgi:hypothetical protein